MSGKGLRFWLAALAAPLLLSSCASYYKIEVTAKASEDHDRSVFLIVYEKEDEKNAKEDEDEGLVRLTDKERTDKYVLYAQFDSAAGKTIEWKPTDVPDIQIPSMLTVALSEENDVLTLTMNKALLEDYPQLYATVLAVGTDGTWFAEDANYKTIDSRDALILKLKDASFEKRQVPASTNSSIPEVLK